MRQLATWASPRVTLERVRHCVEAPSFHFVVVYGVLANARRKWWDRAKEILGFDPQEDAERFAAEFAPVAGADLTDMFHGGRNCAAEFPGDPSRIA
jgi:uronate dehydrogenase